MSGMRSLVFLPLALLLGLVIGAWSPTEELRILRKENEELAKKQASNERNMRLGAFTRIVNIPDRASARQETRRTNRVEVAAHNQPDGAGRAAEGAAEGVAEEQEERRRMSPEDLRARIDEARELWETRVQIAREQWLNKLGLTADARRLCRARTGGAWSNLRF